MAVPIRHLARLALIVPDALWQECHSDEDRVWRIGATGALVAARLVAPDSVLKLGLVAPQSSFSRLLEGPVDPSWSIGECTTFLRSAKPAPADSSEVAIEFSRPGSVHVRGADQDRVRRFAQLFQRVLNALAGRRGFTDAGFVRSQDLVDAGEAERLARLAGRRTDYERDATVPECFEAAVRANPGALAIRAHDGELNYAELESRANRFAWQLVDAGVAPGERVAVALDRCLDLVVAYLGILKAGAVFVPVDERMPVERLSELLQRVQVRRVVTDGSTPDNAFPPRFERLRIADANLPTTASEMPPPRLTRAEDPAYVMFTSGSTGSPKGVVVPHRAIVRLARSADYVTLDAGTVMLGYAPTSFDASTFEVWGALLNGGRLVLAPPGLLSLKELSGFIGTAECTVAWLTAGLFHELVDADLLDPLHRLRCLLTGGDVVSPTHVRRALEVLRGCAVVNGYGPTENTTFSACFRMEAGDDVPAPVPIGRPIPNSSAHVLDREGMAVPIGAVGELWVGGDGVALGYAGGSAEDDRRFTVAPEGDAWAGRRYRTGDLVRWRDDECLEFLGRVDEQVKVRGFRIELGEIETALRQHPSLLDVAVVAPGSGAQRHLVAHVVARPGTAVSPAEVRNFAARLVVDYMVPAVVSVVPRIPKTAAGKVDRRALLAIDPPRTEVPCARPGPSAGAIATQVSNVFTRVLGVGEVGPQDGFFDLGGSSLSALVVLETLRREYGLVVSVADFFQAPTPEGIASRVGMDQTSPRPRAAPARVDERSVDGIAIVGMAGRFPGAPSVDAFWRVVCDGVDTVERFAPATLDSSVRADDRASPDYVAARGLLADVDQFAAGFFGVPRRQAELMDPQLRVLLEVAWEALESCGLLPERSSKTVGVFAGMNHSGYLFHHVLRHPDIVRAVGALSVQFATEKDYVATSLAHRLDLTGPAVSLNTACSTSLVAVAQACQALRAGECDVALAGGVSITVPQRVGHRYDAGAMLSRDGTTRPFDRDATGTVFSDGAGIVVLKPLADAEADGDTVFAVIRGVAVNNDGARRASFTAPSVDGQRRVIRRALDDAGWSAESIGYVEAHGTATPLGDPIEVEALTRTYREDSDATGFCALGSVKGNVGHCTIAAGVAGLIKTALSLHHAVLPASLHFENPNPEIGFERTPFVVNASTRPWPEDGRPRRAGVSSFGVGGTNAHVLLEAHAPSTARATADRASIGGPLLFPLSGETPEQLATLADRVASALPDDPGALADAAYTMGVARRALRHRAFVLADDAAEAKTRLKGGVLSRLRYADAGSRVPRTVFLFAGQGTQYPGMAAALYRREPVFRTTLDQALSAFRSEGVDLSDLLSAGAPSDAAAARLRQTAIAQPAIFAMQLATARLWISWGVRPDAVLGHSIGEYAAAVIAGAFDPADAARLVAARGRAMQACPPGRMLAVRASTEVVTPFLSDDVALAADNAPALCVLSGNADALARISGALDRAGIASRLLETSHAFHSAQMAPAVTSFAPAFDGIPIGAPNCIFLSSCTGGAVGPKTLAHADYWTGQLRAPVRFREAVLAATDRGVTLMLDIGPRSTVAPLARQTLAGRLDARIVATFEGAETPGGEMNAMLRSAGNAWLSGAALDFGALHIGQSRRRVALPPYPLHRERYWLDRPPQELSGPDAASGDAAAVSRLIDDQLEVLRLQRGLLESHA